MGRNYIRWRGVVAYRERESVMSVIGEKFSVELARRKTHGADWTVLKLTDNDGTELGCRWHTDAEKLDPDHTKI